jgi:hypothetical protein
MTQTNGAKRPNGAAAAVRHETHRTSSRHRDRADMRLPSQAVLGEEIGPLQHLPGFLRPLQGERTQHEGAVAVDERPAFEDLHSRP